MMISRMRVLCSPQSVECADGEPHSPQSVECADKIMRSALDIFFAPNKTSASCMRS